MIVHTTLPLAPEILLAARAIARQRSQRLGAGVSQFAREGLKARGGRTPQAGFPVSRVSSGTAPLTPEGIRCLEDEV